MGNPIILEFLCQDCGWVGKRDSALDTCPKCKSHNVAPTTGEPVVFKRGNLKDKNNAVLEVHNSKLGQKSQVKE